MSISARRPDELISILRSDFPLGLIPIAQVTLAAPAASVAFASIPQDFRTLAVIINARTDRNSSGDYINWQANGDVGNNYDVVNLTGNNTLATSANAFAATQATLMRCDAATSLANSFAGGFALFLNYRSTVFNKTALAVSYAEAAPSAPTSYLIVEAGMWRPGVVAAISSLVFFPTVGPNFVAGSVFQLYGVL